MTSPPTSSHLGLKTDDFGLNWSNYTQLNTQTGCETLRRDKREGFGTNISSEGFQSRASSCCCCCCCHNSSSLSPCERCFCSACTAPVWSVAVRKTCPSLIACCSGSQRARCSDHSERVRFHRAPYKASNSSILCLVLPCLICRRVLYLSRPTRTFSVWRRSLAVFLDSSRAWASSEVRAWGRRRGRRMSSEDKKQQYCHSYNSHSRVTMWTSAHTPQLSRCYPPEMHVRTHVWISEVPHSICH